MEKILQKKISSAWNLFSIEARVTELEVPDIAPIEILM
jgi:hypothetical protein